MHRFLSRSDVGASRWLATSGSPEQFGWQIRSHTGKDGRVCGSGQPPVDPYGYVEEAGGTCLRVGGTRLWVAQAVRTARRMISPLQ